MAEEKLLTIREVSQALNISEKEVIDLAEAGRIPAYKVGGVYLRFKREQIEQFKRQSANLVPKENLPEENDFHSSIADFLYFNDFYVAAAVVIIVMLAIIFTG